MNHLLSIYCNFIPFMIILIAKYFFHVHFVFIEELTFYYSMALFNFTCGYHWSLAVTSIEMKARMAAILFCFISVIPSFIFQQGNIKTAGLILIVLLILQLIIEARSDIEESMPLLYKVARFLLTLLMMITIMSVLVLS